MSTLTKEKLEEIQSGADILKHSASERITELRDLLGVSPLVWREAYEATLINMAEFCQNLKVDSDATPYGFFMIRLEWAIKAIKIRRALMLSSEQGVEKMSQLEPLWTYAFFSAALFYQLVDIQNHHAISVHNKAGEKTVCWHPLLGSMLLYGHYFSHPENQEKRLILPNSELMAVLAKTLTPPKVWFWLSQETEVFACWWQALLHPEKASVIQKTLLKVVSNVSVSEEKNAEKKTEIAEEEILYGDTPDDLLQWIEGQSWPEEDGQCFITEEGLFIAEGVVREYAAAKSIANYADVIDSLDAECLLQADGEKIMRYRPADYLDDRRFYGWVIKKAYLPESFQNQRASEKFISDIDSE